LKYNHTVVFSVVSSIEPAAVGHELAALELAGFAPRLHPPLVDSEIQLGIGRRLFVEAYTTLG
jgi:hypothetical protein